MTRRRRITLYIAGTKCDLGDDSFVLFNWAVTDLTNPAVIRNSWSQAVELPGTDTNNRIFGAVFRVDRTVAGGFDPSKRTEFAVYLETGEVLASGYCKLTEVNAGTPPSYKVTLYGSLGDFMYTLAADADGNKRTLADLDYLGGGASELDFTINKAAVQDAWDRLAGDTSKPEIWDVINFAPAYDGIPEGDFLADKGIATAASVGLAAPVDGYDVRSGKTLVSIPDKVDGWAAHDLRSYLQRPVLNVWRMLQAVAGLAAREGWTLDLSDINTTAKWRWRDTWLTRPLLPSLGTFRQDGGSITVTASPQAVTTGRFLLRYDLASVPSGADVTLRAAVKLRLALDADPGAGVPTMYSNSSTTSPQIGEYQSVFFIQAVGYGADDAKVAVSHVTLYGWGSGFFIGARELADHIGYNPETVGSQETEWVESSALRTWSRTGTAQYDSPAIDIEIKGTDIAYVKIIVARYRLLTRTNTVLLVRYDETSLFTSESYGTGYDESGATATSASATATTSGGSSPRSGALITKRMLLSTEGTPADYLAAICKVFGFYLLADVKARKVTVLRRSSFFLDRTDDLTPLADLSEAPQIVPLAFDAKWYDFKLQEVGGAFAKEYEQTEGVQYGIKRVDTGYDFDASPKDLMNGVVLKSAAAVKGVSRYNYSIIRAGVGNIPPVFQDNCTYTLWNVGGESEDFTVPLPLSTDTFFPFNGIAPGYDYASRAEFCDKDGKALDGADVLLVHNATHTLPDMKLTDDTATMTALAGGPCWDLDSAGGLDVPQFTRYIQVGMHLLDFGVPRQVQDPGEDYAAASGIYDDFWAAYIRDRLSVHGKVLRLRVRFDGEQVGPELLRRFWWWRGSLWVISKISNYSLTTFDPAEVELVQVRDKNNYR